jgi:hypothetical protein
LRIVLVRLKYILTHVCVLPSLPTMIQGCFAVKLIWKPFAALANKNKSNSHVRDYEVPFDNESNGIVSMNNKETMLLMDFNLFYLPDDDLQPKHAILSKDSAIPGQITVKLTKTSVWFVVTKEKCWYHKSCALTKPRPFCKQLLFTSLYWSGRCSNWKSLRFTTSLGSVRASPRLGNVDEMIDMSLPVEADDVNTHYPRQDHVFWFPI